jgi:UDP-2,3-diacylglucosamine pyrophosphatase LpxH
MTIDFKRVFRNKNHRKRKINNLGGLESRRWVKNIDGFLYINTGDFVESCTAIVEHFNGSLELVKWHKTESAIAHDDVMEVNEY